MESPGKTCMGKLRTVSTFLDVSTLNDIDEGFPSKTAESLGSECMVFAVF